MADGRKPTGDRQAELVDAALHLIATEGIAALSTRSLARHVGLSSGAIFKHFATREVLLAAVVARVEEVLDATYPSPALPPVERLSAFLAARAGVVGRRAGILRLVLSEQFVLALPAEGSARLAAVVRKTRDFLQATLEAGQRDGSLRGDVPAAELAVVVMGTLQAVALLSASSRTGLHGDRVLASLVTLLLSPTPTTRRPARRATPRSSP